MNTYKPAQIGAGRGDTQLNYYDQSDKRVLGDEAVGHTSFLEQLKKGVRMLQPDTADAYKGVIAPMLLRGEITMEQLEAEVPAMRPGTVARQMLDQAVTELAVQSERVAPQFAPSTLETEAVRGEVIDPERAVTEGDAYDAGLTASRSELEGVPTTEREQRMNDRVLAALGIQDSGAIGPRPSEMAPAQAAYVADVMRRNREGGRVTKGDLMGGPVRSFKQPKVNALAQLLIVRPQALLVRCGITTKARPRACLMPRIAKIIRSLTERLQQTLVLKIPMFKSKQCVT